MEQTPSNKQAVSLNTEGRQTVRTRFGRGIGRLPWKKGGRWEHSRGVVSDNRREPPTDVTSALKPDQNSGPSKRLDMLFLPVKTLASDRGLTAHGGLQVVRIPVATAGDLSARFTDGDGVSTDGGGF